MFHIVILTINDINDNVPQWIGLEYAFSIDEVMLWILVLLKMKDGLTFNAYTSNLFFIIGFINFDLMWAMGDFIYGKKSQYTAGDQHCVSLFLVLE